MTYVQETVLVEKKTKISELEVTYKGNKIENLSKVIFRLENTGRLPIVESDLIAKPTIELLDGIILNIAIEETNPANVEPKIETVGNTARLSFKLLNPNDSITFSILTDAMQPNYNATARIKNVSKLDVVSSGEQIIITKDIGWTVYVVGVFSAFFISIGFMLLAEIPKKNKQLKLLKNNDTPIKEGESMRVVRSYINKDLSFLSGKQEKTVKNMLQNDMDILSDDFSKALLSVVEEQVNEEAPLAGAILSLGIAALGLWYIVNSLISSGV